MGRVDTEVKVATCQVIRAQGLDVGIQLDPRVAVRLGVPTEPAAGVQVKQLAQRGLTEIFGTDHADVFDLGDFTLGDAERQVDAIALNRRDRGDHRDGVQAAVDVLTLELLLGLVSQRFVEGLTVKEARIAQGFLQNVFVKFFAADELHTGHGGTFFNNHHQHITADFKAHVLEKAKRKQGTDRGRTLFVVVRFAYAQGNRGKNSAGLNPLQALNANIAHREGINGPSQSGREHAGGQDRKRTEFKSMKVVMHGVLE